MRESTLRTLVAAVRRLRGDRQGQDLIEYALLSASGFLAVAVVLPQQMAPTISAIFSTITRSLSSASNGS